MSEYDSRADTLTHIARVAEHLGSIAGLLRDRAERHDASKLEEPEKSVFDRVTPRLKGLTYGSPEYRENTAKLGDALRHHYANNRHHPEHNDEWVCMECKAKYSRALGNLPVVGYPDSDYRWCPVCFPGGYPGFFETSLLRVKGSGVSGMTLVDLVEMFCDWCAATERHADGDIFKSIAHNQTRFGFGDVLGEIFRNTAIEYDMGKGVKEDA